MGRCRFRGEEKQLTFGGSELLLHGEPDWIYQEELAVRTGYHWAPDSRRIAFLELDETAVPAYPIVEQTPPQATVDFQRYPKSGDPNPKARAGVVDLQNVRTVWSDRTPNIFRESNGRMPALRAATPESCAE